MAPESINGTINGADASAAPAMKSSSTEDELVAQISNLQLTGESARASSASSDPAKQNLNDEPTQTNSSKSKSERKQALQATAHELEALLDQLQALRRGLFEFEEVRHRVPAAVASRNDAGPSAHMQGGAVGADSSASSSTAASPPRGADAAAEVKQAAASARATKLDQLLIRLDAQLHDASRAFSRLSDKLDGLERQKRAKRAGNGEATAPLQPAGGVVTNGSSAPAGSQSNGLAMEDGKQVQEIDDESDDSDSSDQDFPPAFATPTLLSTPTFSSAAGAFFFTPGSAFGSESICGSSGAPRLHSLRARFHSAESHYSELSHDLELARAELLEDRQLSVVQRAIDHADSLLDSLQRALAVGEEGKGKCETEVQRLWRWCEQRRSDAQRDRAAALHRQERRRRRRRERQEASGASHASSSASSSAAMATEEDAELQGADEGASDAEDQRLERQIEQEDVAARSRRVYALLDDFRESRRKLRVKRDYYVPSIEKCFAGLDALLKHRLTANGHLVRRKQELTERWTTLAERVASFERELLVAERKYRADTEAIFDAVRAELDQQQRERADSTGGALPPSASSPPAASLRGAQHPDDSLDMSMGDISVQSSRSGGSSATRPPRSLMRTSASSQSVSSYARPAPSTTQSNSRRLSMQPQQSSYSSGLHESPSSSRITPAFSTPARPVRAASRPLQGAPATEPPRARPHTQSGPPPVAGSGRTAQRMAHQLSSSSSSSAASQSLAAPQRPSSRLMAPSLSASSRGPSPTLSSSARARTPLLQREPAPTSRARAGSEPPLDFEHDTSASWRDRAEARLAARRGAAMSDAADESIESLDDVSFGSTGPTHRPPRAGSSLGFSNDLAFAQAPRTPGGRPLSTLGAYYRPPPGDEQLLSRSVDNASKRQSFIPRLSSNSTIHASDHPSRIPRPGSSLSNASFESSRMPTTPSHRNFSGASRLTMQTPEPVISARAQRMNMFGRPAPSGVSGPAGSAARKSARPPPTRYSVAGMPSHGSSGTHLSVASPPSARKPSSASGRATPLSAAALARVPDASNVIQLGRAPSTNGLTASAADTSDSSIVSYRGTRAGASTPTFSERSYGSRSFAGSAYGGSAYGSARRASAAPSHEGPYSPNPNDELDVEVARIANDLGVQLCRLDAPLGRGQKLELGPGKEAQAKYMLGGRTVVCKILELVSAQAETRDPFIGR